jgi:hypothetical protein
MSSDERKQQIRYRVDRKARSIADSSGAWGNSIIEEMRIAVPFELSQDELTYLEEYVRWRREHPLEDEA